MLDRIIRVDQAGELGADRIYAGQLAVLGKTSVGPVIKVKYMYYTFIGCCWRSSALFHKKSSNP